MPEKRNIDVIIVFSPTILPIFVRIIDFLEWHPVRFSNKQWTAVVSFKEKQSSGDLQNKMTDCTVSSIFSHHYELNSCPSLNDSIWWNVLILLFLVHIPTELDKYFRELKYRMNCSLFSIYTTPARNPGGGNFGYVVKGVYRTPSGQEVPVAVKTLKPNQITNAGEVSGQIYVPLKTEYLSTEIHLGDFLFLI